MTEIFDSLKRYFKETPKEQLDKDWDEIKHLNEVGPDVRDVLCRPVNSWIKVEEKLPEDYFSEDEYSEETFLLAGYRGNTLEKEVFSEIPSYQDLELTFGSYYGNNKWKDGGWRKFYTKYWMIIPKLPEE